MAPINYLQTNAETTRYNTSISYEAIRDWLQENTPATARRDFRLRIVAEAIQQNRRGRTKHTDERVASFFRELWQFR